MNSSIDTNIIISVYFSDITNDNKDNVRKKYYQKWADAKKIFVSKVAILELYNFILRNKFKEFQKNVNRNIKLTKFTKMDEFISIKKEILIKLNSLFNDDKIEIIGSTREEIRELVSNDLEPNDLMILNEARKANTSLLTEDSDFAQSGDDIILITNN